MVPQSDQVHVAGPHATVRARHMRHRAYKEQAASHVQGAGGERNVRGEGSGAPFVDCQGSSTFVAVVKVRRLFQQVGCMHVCRQSMR